jgi:hypothetical protein
LQLAKKIFLEYKYLTKAKLMAQPTTPTQGRSEVRFTTFTDEDESDAKFHLIDDSTQPGENAREISALALPGIGAMHSSATGPAHPETSSTTSTTVLRFTPVHRPTRVHKPLEELFNYDGKTPVQVAPHKNWEGEEVRGNLRRAQSERRFVDRKHRDTVVHHNASPVTTHHNPLYKECNASTMRSHLTHFCKLPDKLFYDIKKAEKELSGLIQKHPEHLDLILSIVLEVREQARVSHSKRFQELLILAFQRPQNVPFFLAYFKKTDDDMKEFVSAAVSELVHKGEQRCLPHIFSAGTHSELFDSSSQTRHTLFREVAFSSYVGKEYGTWLLKDAFRQLDSVIMAELKKYDPELLNTSREAAVRALQRHPEFDKLDPATQNARIDQEQKRHADAFAGFAKSVLEAVYQIDFPPAFCELLKGRREQILRFMERHPLENEDKPIQFERSRAYLSELLFLRIICPHFTFFSSNPDVQRVMIQLSKVAQGLANETETSFGEPTIFESMNGLYPRFIDAHRRFVDTCSVE